MEHRWGRDGTLYYNDIPHGGACSVGDHYRPWIGARHSMNILINGYDVEVTADEITFEAVARFAVGYVPKSPLTVTYTRGVRGARGSITPGDRIEVAEGMAFVAVSTNRA